MSTTLESQPIIRGIQAVGSVQVYYFYNGGTLTLPSSLIKVGDNTDASIKFDSTNDPLGVVCTGFRLDSDFLEANQQVASSVQIPLLGGGALALTNNNRSGTLRITTTRVGEYSATEKESTTRTLYAQDQDESGNITYEEAMKQVFAGSGVGSLVSNETSHTGVLGAGTHKYYDLTFLLQAQQAQVGGDAQGATITIAFSFGTTQTVVQFQGCTVANIKPLGLSGNNAVDYGAEINYLNWTVHHSTSNTVAV